MSSMGPEERAIIPEQGSDGPGWMMPCARDMLVGATWGVRGGGGPGGGDGVKCEEGEA